MEQESRRKGPRSPSADSDDSSHRRRSRKYDRSPSPRRSRYRRSRSRDRRSRSSSRDQRRKETNRSQQEWKQQTSSQSQSAAANPAGSSGYVPPVHNQYQVIYIYHTIIYYHKSNFHNIIKYLILINSLKIYLLKKIMDILLS